jgi:hypothetical protein
VNTRAEYRRHGHQPPERPVTEAESAVNELARHRDPSLTAQARTPKNPQKRIAWIRPTDLASYGGPMVGRGIDHQAVFDRRARRTPISATRPLRRSAPNTPPPSPNHPEGLQL